MRVLEAFGEPISYGGQESFVVNLVKNMDLCNLKIDFFTPYYCDNDNYRKIVKYCGGDIFSLNLKFSPGKNRFFLKKYIDDFFYHNNYDVVHIHSGSTSMLAIISYSAKKSGVRKVIVHSHASVDTLTFKRKILRLVCNYFMSKTVDLYCACSVVAAKAKFVERKNVLIIKNGISLSNFIYDDGKRRCIRSSLNICNDNFVVGHVGRFSDEKNHEFLLNIFYSIWLSNHSSRLMLIGNGDLEDKTKDQVNALGIKDYVDFIGVVNNVYDYMQAMDCFILPSKFEGLGLVAVEAQAMGLPCYLADTVPKDVEITDLVHYISLAKTSEQWANEIISYPFKIRRNMCKSISQAGYDIKKVSQQMRNIYIS